MNESAARKPRWFALSLAIAFVALAADFATKELALAQFSYQDPVELLGGFLKLTLIFNSGAAFSIGSGVTWLFSLLALGVVAYILRMATRLRSAGWTVALGLVLGGASGNLIDRIFRPASREQPATLIGADAQGSLLSRIFDPPAPLHGHVVDWIQLPHWPVFNLADSAIVCGGVLLVLLAFLGINIDGTRERDKKSDEQDAEQTEPNTPDTQRTTAGGGSGQAAEDTSGSAEEADTGSTSTRSDEHHD